VTAGGSGAPNGRRRPPGQGRSDPGTRSPFGFSDDRPVDGDGERVGPRAAEEAWSGLHVLDLVTVDLAAPRLASAQPEVGGSVSTRSPKCSSARPVAELLRNEAGRPAISKSICTSASLADRRWCAMLSDVDADDQCLWPTCSLGSIAAPIARPPLNGAGCGCSHSRPDQPEQSAGVRSCPPDQGLQRRRRRSDSVRRTSVGHGARRTGSDPQSGHQSDHHKRREVENPETTDERRDHRENEDDPRGK